MGFFSVSLLSKCLFIVVLVVAISLIVRPVSAISNESLVCNGSDIDSDGVVNKSDLDVLGDWWYKTCDAENNWCDGSDVDRSGFVDLGDLLKVGDCYSEKPLSCNGTDLNDDGIVNQSDVDIVGNWWYQTCNDDNLWCNNSDVDRSGFVDLGDLMKVGDCFTLENFASMSMVENLTIVATLNNSVIVNGAPYSGNLRFQLNENKLEVTLILYNSSGYMQTIGSYSVVNSSDLPLKFSIPDGLAPGSYVLNMNVENENGTNEEYGLASFSIVAAESPKQEETTGGNSGGGGGGGSFVGGFNSNTIAGEDLNGTIPEQNQSGADLKEEENESSGFVSGITGAVIGAWNNSNVRLGVYILLGLAVVYGIVALRNRSED